MSRPHVLLASPSRQGLAIPIDLPQPSFASAHTRGLAAKLEGQSPFLFDSFRQAGDLAWRVLMCSPQAAALGAGEPSRLGYRLQNAGTEAWVDQWSSADLAFFITALLDRLALACGATTQPISPLAATGQLFDAPGSGIVCSTPHGVHAIGGVESKLQAALTTLAPIEQARILIPAANLPELSRAQRDWVERGVIVPVQQLQDVLDALKTLPVLPPVLREVLQDLYAPFEGNPYRGIEAFGIEHRGLYFGRKPRIDEVLAKLPESSQTELPAVLISGFSGSGKSSLLLAGVLGTVLHTQVRGRRFLPQPGTVADLSHAVWRVPARADLSEATLCQALCEHWQRWPRITLPPVQTLAELADALIPMLKPSQAQSAHWVFAVDQLEALVTQIGQDEPARHALQHLLEAFAQHLQRLAGEAGVWVLATLRSGHLEALAPLWKRVFHSAGHVDLNQPLESTTGAVSESERWTRQENERRIFLQEIIERPAMLAGFTLEDGLLEDLIRDARDPQSLPLLEFALQDLYQHAATRHRQNPSATMLTRADYDQIGGIRGAINQRANLLLGNAGADRELLLGALARLAREHIDARGQREYLRTTAAWSSFSEREQALLQAWFNADQRLLTLQGDQVEVAHEALLREFTALRDWLLSHAQLLRWRQDHLLPQMRRWVERGQDPAHLLLASEDLDIGERAMQQIRLLAVHEAAFVQASLVAARQRQADLRSKAEELDQAKRRAVRRMQIGLAVTGMLLALAVVAGWAALSAANRNAELNAAMQDQLDDAASRALGRASDALARGDSPAYHAFLAESLTFAPNPAAMDAAERMLQYPMEVPEGRLPRSVLQLPDGMRWLGFSPSGSHALTADETFAVHIWDLQAGRPIGKPMPHAAVVSAAQFSHDGLWIVTASDSLVHIWAAASGLPEGPPVRHEGQVIAAQFSPDGQRLLTLDNYPRRASYHLAHLWDVQTLQPVGKPIAHGRGIASAQFSPDGRKLLTRSSDLNDVQTWDATSATAIGKPMKHPDYVLSAHLSPDGRLAVSACRDRTARIWNVATGELVTHLQHDHDLRHVQFSPDGRWIVTLSEDNAARLWSVRTGEHVGVPLQHEGSIDVMRFNADGRWFVTGSKDQTARVWETSSGRAIGQPMHHEQGVEALMFTADGRWILTTSRDGRVHSWPAHTNAPQAERVSVLDFPMNARFSPDSRRILVQDSTGEQAHLSIRAMDIRSAQTAGPPIRHEQTITDQKFSPDGRSIATTSIDGTARIWDADTHAPVGEAMRHAGSVRTLAFSPDGNWLATGSMFPGNELVGIIRLWDARTGLPIETAQPMVHQGGVTSVSMSPDGQLLASSSTRDGSVRIWNREAGTPFGHTLQHDHGVLEAIFSPDGQLVATRSFDHSIRVWHALSGTLLGNAMQHHEATTLDFSPDGRWLLSSNTSELQIWDTRTGTPIGGPIKPDAPAYLARFVPYETSIVSLHPNGGDVFRKWSAQSRFGVDQHRLAEALRAFSGTETDARGQMQTLASDERQQARISLQRSTPGDSMFDQAIQWHFADPYTRTVSPFATQTIPQLISKAIDFALSGSPGDAQHRQASQIELNDAYKTDPGHPLILLTLSLFEDNPDTLRSWRELTLQRVSADVQLSTRAAQILHQAGDLTNARRAAGIALALDPHDEHMAALLADTDTTSDATHPPPAAKTAPPAHATVPAGCTRAVALEHLESGFALRRASANGWTTLRSIARLDAVSEPVVSGGAFYVAVTHLGKNISTELWRAGCTDDETFSSLDLPDALMRPELFAVNDAVYLIDLLAADARPEHLPGGTVDVPVPVRRFPGSNQNSFQTLYPCKPGYRPVALSRAAAGTVQASCWSGGNAADSSHTVDLQQ